MSTGPARRREHQPAYWYSDLPVPLFARALAWLYGILTGLRRWFWAMPWGERYIWGVTAGILKGLHARLYGEEAEPEAAADEDAA